MLNSYLKAVKKGLRNDTNVDEILIAVKVKYLDWLLSFDKFFTRFRDFLHKFQITT